MLTRFINLLPLLLAVMFSCAGAAIAQGEIAFPSSAMPAWVTALSSQGLAVALVIWWIAVGYPAWRKDNERQRAEDRASIKECLSAANDKQERIFEALTEVRENLLQRPCQLPPRK